MRWLRTISGRIVLGFVVLQTTFGVVAGYTVWQMNRLGERLRFIRAAYLEIQPDVAFFEFYTGQVVLELERDAPTSKARMAGNRERRHAKLIELQDKLAGLTGVPPNFTTSIETTRRDVETIATLHKRNDALFAAAFPPSDARKDPEAIKAATAELSESERRLNRAARNLHERLQAETRHLIVNADRAERYARYWALILGGLASGVTLLVTIWAVLTLRPLRRLTDGARRVARGDYRGRVDASGGTEVAELASEFNAMAQAIEEREQELVRSARLAAVGKMAAVITHEVRNPLSSIGLNTELLEDELEKLPDDAEGKQLLASIQKEVDRLTAITEEYLRFARLPRPKLEAEQVNDIAAELVEFQRGELAARNVQVIAELAEALPLVRADEGQLRQALLNLVRNAADAMSGQGGGTLRLSTRKLGEATVEVRVADTGPGIPEEHRARVFEPFFSTKDGGTGLGLALTQQIVVEHGGRIAVESSGSGGGTTFVIELPAASA